MQNKPIAEGEGSFENTLVYRNLKLYISQRELLLSSKIMVAEKTNKKFRGTFSPIILILARNVSHI